LLVSSDAGRVAISAAIVVVLTAMVTANLPDSWLKQRLGHVADPVIDATGLVQVWGVFAPDPRRQSVDIEARIRFSDGTTGVWHDPEGSPLLDDYWLVRWRKLLEWAIADAYKDTLWQPLAAFVAREAATTGKRPVEVTLVRRWSDLRPPGSEPSRAPWREVSYYTLQVTDDMIESAA
jgi:hypothetical protein